MAESLNAENTKRSNSAKRGVNYGYRLYKKGLKTIAEQEKKIKEARKEKELDEKRKYSFKPEINENSKIIAKDNGKEKLETRLMMFGQIVQEKIEQQKSAMALESKMKCTFHPEVNKKYNISKFIGVKKLQVE